MGLLAPCLPSRNRPRVVGTEANLMSAQITVMQRELRASDPVEVSHEFVAADFSEAKRTPTIFALWQLSRKFDLAVQHANADLKAGGNAAPQHTTNSVFTARITIVDGGVSDREVALPQATGDEGDDYADLFLNTVREAIAQAKEDGSS